MPHAEEHPLAGRRVVPLFAGEDGATVHVVDWLDRMPELWVLLTSDTSAGMAYRARTRDRELPDDGIVVAGDGRGRCLVHHAELPAYGLAPLGVSP